MRVSAMCTRTVGSSDQFNFEKFGVMKNNGLRHDLTPIFELIRTSLEQVFTLDLSIALGKT